MYYHKKQVSQSGQIGLVVLLIGAVLMTIGLGVVSQSVIETKTARQETESTQAYNFAEQGIEGVLGGPLSHGDSGEIPTVGGFSGTYNVAEQTRYEGTTVLPGHSAEVNLDPASSSTLTIEWPNNNADILVALIQPNGTLRRYGFGLTTANFVSSGSTPDNAASFSCTPTPCRATFNNVTGYEIARIKVLYNQTNLTILGSHLPVQSHTVSASVSHDGSGETREVQVNKTLPVAPSIFDYVLFAGTGHLSH